MRPFFKKLIRLLYPERCTNCGEIIPIEKNYCLCRNSNIVKLSDDFCEHCAGEKDSCVCGRKGTVYLEHIVAVYDYSGLIREKLLKLKFRGEKKEAIFFAEKMSIRFVKAYPKVRADYITFVPMIKEDIAERGYNQSKIIAKEVGKRLNVKCEKLLIKKEKTKSQHTLNQKERLENLIDVFSVNEEFSLRDKTIILCDDIKTTGTTLRRCCDVLYGAGAAEVYCLCAAIAGFADLPF